MSTTTAPTFTEADTRECRTCSQPIILVRCWNGNFIPFNPEPDARGNHRVEEEEGFSGEATGTLVGTYVRTADRNGPMFRQHRCNERKKSTVRVLAQFIRDVLDDPEFEVEVPDEIVQAVDSVLAGAYPGKIA